MEDAIGHGDLGRARAGLLGHDVEERPPRQVLATEDVPLRDDPGLAFALARLTWESSGAVPLGVFRSVGRPVYEDLVHEQVRATVEHRGEGDLAALLHGSDTWTIG